MNNIPAIIREMPIKARSDGRFEGRLSANGKRKSFYGKTKVEVKNRAKEYLSKVENGFKEPKRILLRDYIEYWLIHYKKNKIEPSSYTRLYRVYECQIKNTIGQKMIGDIGTSDIQSLIDSHANPKDKNTKPLAMSGLKRILQLLRPCLQMAVREGVISENPCDNVSLPTASCIQVETKRQFSMTDEEIALFREAALSKYKTTGEYCSRDALVLLMILNLGLRVGEALALEWTDIDYTNNLIRIDKTIQSNIIDFESTHGKNTTYNRIKKSTKTSAGIRPIQLNSTVRWYLEELKGYDKRKGISSNYICCTNTGTLNVSRNLQRSLDRVIKKAGIQRRVTLHTLRHTFGSTLLRNGVNIEVVSELMGHANISVTYNKYIHTVKEEKMKAMNMVTIC